MYRLGRCMPGIVFASMLLLGVCSARELPHSTVTISGKWTLSVTVDTGDRKELKATVYVDPQPATKVLDLRYPSLMLFNSSSGVGGWTRGSRLPGVRACEATEPGTIDPNSVEVHSVSDNATNHLFKRGVDFQIDNEWGTIGRIASGSIGAHEPLSVDYKYYAQRLDSIVLTAKNTLDVRKGTPDVALPKPPALQPGEVRIANIWIHNNGRHELSAADIFVISDTRFPSSLDHDDGEAISLLSHTISKLRHGRKVTIIAWGDSVTAGACLDSSADRWQEVFARRLKRMYPNATIDLLTEAWPAHNTAQYLAAPVGDVHNFQEKVLDLHPDLVISEFVNDSSLTVVETETRYSLLLKKFRQIDAEWIILTPAYVYPGRMDGPYWAGISDEHNIDHDPRDYVQGLRDFAVAHDVTLADASLRWGRLWREGIPYTTLLANSINHPDARGHMIYADVLLALFRPTQVDH